MNKRGTKRLPFISSEEFRKLVEKTMGEDYRKVIAGFASRYKPNEKIRCIHDLYVLTGRRSMSGAKDLIDETPIFFPNRGKKG